MERAIAVLTDVKDLSELLHGAGVDQARLVPSSGGLRLELGVTRAMPEQATVVRRGFLSRTKTPWTKSRLVLERIREASVQRVAEIPSPDVPLLACEAIPGGYSLVLTAPDGLQLALTLEQLQGHFSDVGSPMVLH